MAPPVLLLDRWVLVAFFYRTRRSGVGMSLLPERFRRGFTPTSERGLPANASITGSQPAVSREDERLASMLVMLYRARGSDLGLH